MSETKPVSEPTVVEPVDPASTALEVAEHGPVDTPAFAGHLAIRPDQKRLTEEQIAALSAIVNFSIDLDDPQVRRDWPQARANINVFMHVCQSRGLDPWARQIYLVRRGKKDNYSYTVQTGIEGYRYLAELTGRTLGPAKIFWSGQDDDERSWREVTDPDTGITYMDRRWWGAWPKSRGNPGMARAVLRYRTSDGHVAVSDVIAHWGMFAPYHDKWDYDPKERKRVPVKDEHGRPVRELGEMWARDGGAHMLAKCLPGKAWIRTDQGPIRIKDIVKHRMPVKVRSVDLATGRETWQPVVNWWTNPPTREWVRLWSPNGSRGNKPIRLTPDHPVWTPDGWVKAGEIAEGDLIAVTSPTLTPQQEQVILGGLLGDGTLTGRKRRSTLPHYAEAHCQAQEGYLRWKADSLANLQITWGSTLQSDGKGGSHPTVKMRTAAAAVLYRFRRQTPVERLAELGDLGVAVWLMDDASIRLTGRNEGGAQRPYIKIYCCGFAMDFAEAAVRFFRDRYGVTAQIRRLGRESRRDIYLTIGAEDSPRLLERLRDYIRHDPDANTKEWVADPIAVGLEKGMAFVPAIKVEHVTLSKPEARYDIEVEGTHTFVTNGVVVSNCAEAAAIRKAFPKAVAGIVVDEELHRSDVAAQESAGDQRREEYLKAQEQAQDAVRQHEDPDDGQRPTAMLRLSVQDVVTPATTVPTDAQRRAWLLEELEEMARIRGGDAREGLNFVRARLGVEDLDGADPADLLTVIGPLRETAVHQLRTDADAADAAAEQIERSDSDGGDEEVRTRVSTLRAKAARKRAEADAYARAGGTVVAPVQVLLGREDPAETDPAAVPEDGAQAEEAAGQDATLPQ